MRKKALVLAVLMMAAAVVCGPLFAGGGSQGTAGSSGGSAKMTDVGTPRAETLIVDNMDGIIADPTQFNPLLPGWSSSGGYHQLLLTGLYQIDSMKGEVYPELAAELPKPEDATYTKFTIKLLDGIKWTDGVNFTADDVVYSAEMVLKTPELTPHAAYKDLFKRVTKIDAHTVQIETNNPEPKLAARLGSAVWGPTFFVLPKHIWEKQDPKTFRNSNPIGLDCWLLKDLDKTGGTWYLFEKRPDWQNGLTGKRIGEPKMKYVLFRSYGTEERRVMAMLNNDYDIMVDVSPESLSLLMERNKNVKAWFNGFPYGNPNDPAGLGTVFNCDIAPYDNPDVRWALTLATDTISVSISICNGMLRFSPIQAPPLDPLMNAYHKPMLPWLKNFALADGYKPFDDTYPDKMLEALKAQGVANLPATPEAKLAAFGIGWWKYDTVEAAKLLTKNGFSQRGGRWYLPDGTPWKISLVTMSDSAMNGKLGYAVADSWRKFGIDVEARGVDSATWGASQYNGLYEVGVFWPTTPTMVDMTTNMLGWHSRFYRPNGEYSINIARFKNAYVDKRLDELLALPSDNPQVIQKLTEIFQEMVRQMPMNNMVGTTKIVPVNTTYWTGYQSADNPFEGPWWWWDQFRTYLPRYRPTGVK
ncbi:ABC transporter substrate-binding protein [Treponema sp. TIM-1]|uniref:ABC transporter substrate-binding protein n=1 Tax=Treponema sp. TIM-1 TaxID=2898417 RepID=UPI00397F9ACD